MPAEKNYQGETLPASFRLIETMRFKHRIRFLDDHLERMYKSAQFFEIPFDDSQARLGIKAAIYSIPSEKFHKVRLTLDSTGQFYVEVIPLSAESRQRKLVYISPDYIDARDPFFHHKTTRREFYESAYAEAVTNGFYEVLFLNNAGFLAEGSRNNVFVKSSESIYTPPLASGALGGIYRKKLLERLPRIEEKQMTPADLYNADALYVSNAVRGLRRVYLSRPTE